MAQGTLRALESAAKIRARYVGESFILVTAEDIEGKLIGEGLSRKSDKDELDIRIGYEIARGRAPKALQIKMNGRPVRHRFMG